MHYISSSNMGIDENGNPCFVDGPPGTKVNAAILNALVREVTNVIVRSGLTVLTKDTDTYDQLWDSLQVLGRPYDLIVSSQITFNSMIERVAANHYQIKSQYKSIFVKNITSGFNSTSWLSGGDTWGYLDTNTCSQMDFESGAYISCGDNPFYLNVNTNDATLNNIWIKGSGLVAAACTQSFRHYAYRVTYNNCKVSDRYSNLGHIAFNGNDALAANSLMIITTKFNNCIVYNIHDNNQLDGLIGFYKCYNLNNCITYALTEDEEQSYCYGFDSCNLINNAFVKTISSSFATTFTGGFNNCMQLTNCTANDIITSDVTGIGGWLHGFISCTMLTNCYVDNVHDGNNDGGNGFDNCTILSSCYAINIAAEAFSSCTYISSVNMTSLVNSGNDYVDTDDASITNKYSTPVSADGKWD